MGRESCLLLRAPCAPPRLCSYLPGAGGGLLREWCPCGKGSRAVPGVGKVLECVHLPVCRGHGAGSPDPWQRHRLASPTLPDACALEPVTGSGQGWAPVCLPLRSEAGCVWSWATLWCQLRAPPGPWRKYSFAHLRPGHWQPPLGPGCSPAGFIAWLVNTQEFEDKGGETELPSPGWRSFS